MRFYWIYKVLIANIIVAWGISICFAQQKSDSLAYEKYDNNYVWYTDLGFNSAPVTLVYPFPESVHKLKLRNNYNNVLGFGFSYKWFALRLGVNLPGTARSSSRFGNTKYYDLGFDFSFKRLYFDVDFHWYQGYAYKNATSWNDTLNSLHPNLIRSDLNTASFSLNTWHFWSDQFKMQAFRGKTAAYLKDVQTFYLKYTMNIHGIGSSEMPIIPTELIDTNATKTRSTTLSAFDFGVIPGYAYVRRWNQFQIGAMGGLGLVVQSKFYSGDFGTRGFLGLAPRMDFKLIAGFNRPHYFVMLVTDFDHKSIRFQQLTYRQTYYSLKLVAGIRLKDKKNSNKKSVKRLNRIDKVF